jgi:hypothetical protein
MFSDRSDSGATTFMPILGGFDSLVEGVVLA